MNETAYIHWSLWFIMCPQGGEAAAVTVSNKQGVYKDSVWSALC